MNKINLMKSAVTIILLLLIIYSLNYINTELLNIEHFENEDLNLKLVKMLDITLERCSVLNHK
jgi:hypothetical protein